MELKSILENNYRLGSIKSIMKTEKGSGDTYLVKTVNQKYIAKVNVRQDFINIYNDVQKLLRQIGFVVSGIMPTADGDICTKCGLVLYEFLDGQSYSNLTYIQMKNALDYLRDYNKALVGVSSTPENILMLNHWDQARSLAFIVEEFPAILSTVQLSDDGNAVIQKAVNILSVNRSFLHHQTEQLIHADLGPDNIMFTDNDVLSIIDFTPEYNHHLYSIAQFVYWNIFWHGSKITHMELNEVLSIYLARSASSFEIKLFSILLVRSAIFRIAGPLLDKLHNGVTNYNSLKKRLHILRKTIELYEDLD